MTPEERVRLERIADPTSIWHKDGVWLLAFVDGLEAELKHERVFSSNIKKDILVEKSIAKMCSAKIKELEGRLRTCKRAS